jgi:uncharacterized protein (TIGR02145 family)
MRISWNHSNIGQLIILISVVFLINFFSCEQIEYYKKPAIQTVKVENATAFTIQATGEIIDYGDTKMVEYGFCWSTSDNPTKQDNVTRLNLNSIQDIFNYTITGLQSNQKYYLRAFATNETGTAYGNVTSFTTNDGDIILTTIKIGNQIWMAENLKTTHYANGAEITLVEDGAAWSALGYTDKAMCYYDNSTTNADTYGALYTWAAAMNGVTSSTTNPSGIQGACPDGWHIPSDAEWKELEMYLGMSQAQADVAGWRGTTEGSKLAGNADLWTNGSLENDAAFGTSGFLALPAGRRYSNGTFTNLGYGANFWSATEYGASNAWSRFLYYYYSEVYRYDCFYKNSGFSVRCIKD